MMYGVLLDEAHDAAWRGHPYIILQNGRRQKKYIPARVIYCWYGGFNSANRFFYSC